MPVELEARNSADGNLVFISYGANDLAVKEGVRVVEPENSDIILSQLFSMPNSFPKDIYLVSILPVSKNIDGVVVSSGKLRSNEEVVAYNDILKSIAADYSLGYIDFHSALFEDKEILLSADGVHPNEKGYGMMAEIAVPIIEKYL
jgi:lysophospholipase L1-like esterase